MLGLALQVAADLVGDLVDLLLGLDQAGFGPLGPLSRSALPPGRLPAGARGIGGSMWIGPQEDESVRALRRAIELGVNFIDIARGYGESERIAG